MAAVLFGSISTLADTSELQRDAFNRAFAEHGLDWSWDVEEYRSLLGSNGGAGRIAAYARERGEQVDTAAVHATKSKLFQESLASSGIEARPGVVNTVRAAQQAGVRLGLVTTTSRANIDALLKALAPDVTADAFAVIVDVDSVEEGKPDPAAYTFALAALGDQAGDAVAVEDNEGGVRSAADAGVVVIAFPNENTAGGSFDAARSVVDAIDPAELLALVNA